MSNRKYSQKPISKPEESGFTAQGFDGMPNFYEDNKRIGECTEWSDAALETKRSTYEDWRQRDIMPRAKEASRRILNHLDFEQAYRAGVFAIPDDIESLDEACEGA